MMWLLSDRQLANITPKIKRTIKWLKRGRLGELHEVKLEYHSGFDEWWLHINGHGCGATYTIAENAKRWKLI